MVSGNVSLRYLGTGDADVLAKLANDQQIWDNVRDCFPRPYSLQNALEFIATTSSEVPRVTFGIFFSDELAGVLGLIMQSDIYKLSAEIGYWIGQPYTGRGIATSAVELGTNYGFRDLGLRRIFAGVFEKNVGSMKVLEKNGYAKEAIFKNAILKNGEVLDEYRYARWV